MLKIIYAFFISIFSHLFNQFILLVMVISGLVSVVTLVMTAVYSGGRVGSFVGFLFSSGICFGMFKALKRMHARGSRLVESINAKESINLNPINMIGGPPSPIFMVFDKVNRKFALCNSATGDYKVHDFSYILKWSYDWGVGQKTSVSLASIENPNMIPGTNMGRPVFETTEHKRNFTIVLEVADANRPILKIPAQSEAAAKEACAKLNAIFNG